MIDKPAVCGGNEYKGGIGAGLGVGNDYGKEGNEPKNHAQGKMAMAELTTTPSIADTVRAWVACTLALV